MLTVNFSFPEVKRRCRDIVGAITDDEKKFLFNAARHGKGRGVIVEIGSFQGMSTVYLGSGSKGVNRGKVYAIDPHKGSSVISRKFSGPTYTKFLSNLKRAKVNDWVNPLKKYSHKAIKGWKLPIRLLFIDGNHAYPSVKRDMELWEPFLAKNGTVVLHDVLNPAVGPAKVVVDYVLNGKCFSNFGVKDSIFYATKKPVKGFKEVINLKYYLLMMKIVTLMLGMKKSKTPTKLRRFMRQYLVKRVMRKLLS